MTTLHVEFPAGRYHATPSGQHVNEGGVEWPPSPWRIIRALIAVGYTTQRWTNVPADAGALFEKMAGSLPSYQLPEASLAHSRHYMPLAILDKGREKTTLVYDTWADVSGGTMAIEWPVELTTAETALLATLCDALGYLGRSESWVEVSVRPNASDLANTQRAYPCVGAEHPGLGWEQITLMAPDVADTFAAWRDRALQHALAPLPLPEGAKKPSKKLLRSRENARSVIPESLLDALQWDTARWKGHQWGQPPGSRRVLYWRRSNALETAPPVVGRRSATPPRVESTLLCVATPSRSRSALPSVAQTLPQAERLHRALISRLTSSDTRCPELTGRDEHRLPLKGHRHAYVLPVDLDRDGQIDHFVIHARMGLSAVATSAIRSLRKSWQKRGPVLEISVAGSGDLEDLRGLPSKLSAGVEALLGRSGGAKNWVSQTPFVPPRFVKPRGSNTLCEQVRRELESHGHPSAEVEVLPWDETTLHMRHAVRVRDSKRKRAENAEERRAGPKPPPVDCGFVIRLRFAQPVAGPISLGYASHFGMGLFRAEPS